MLRYRLIGGCLAGGFVAVLLFMGGRVSVAKPSVPKPVWNDEELSISAEMLTAYLMVHDPDALAYTFPSPLGCRRSTVRWHRGVGLDCVFGVTYVNESTRRYTVTLDSHNMPVAPIHRTPLLVSPAA